MTQRSRRRRGFTLLEMILAMAIGLVLMTAVYMMFDTQFTHAKAGRGAIEEATMVRGILTRISRDVAGNLGPYDPKQVPETSTETQSAPMTTAAAAPTDTLAIDSSGGLRFNFGIQGDAGQLSLCVTRVPRELLGADKLRLDPAALPKVCDLRRITYWMVEGKGLAYQEVTRITGDNVDSLTDDTDQPIKYISEVKSISFQYWDGEGWTTSWDSDERPDGDTPIGPPAAIEIVLEMQSGQNADGEALPTRKYRHVVNVPTGNNYSTQMTP